MQSIINNNMNYFCAYLRKSRKDQEAELQGQGETLARHEKRLIDYANSVGIKISKFYKEVVSGETISARPVMQQLLEDVENGMWTGVLVVEVERLARGNTLDQGIVSNAFQYSNTKIITPVKTYDPNKDEDEEYFEFGLFMSRREYKTINRRLHNGILSSVNEGKFIAPEPPYGYEKYKLPKQKGYSLKIVPNEAEMVRLIYKWYTELNGIKTIANKLHTLGYKPKKSDYFATSTITNILTNPIYIGKIQYNDKETIKKVKDGEMIRVKNSNNNLITVNGLHDPIIDINTWNKVQDIRKGHLVGKIHIDYGLKNPMSGILRCGICGKALQRVTQNSRNDVRICCRNCRKIVSSNIEIVESKLMESLNALLKDYKIKFQKKDFSDIDKLLQINENSIINYNDEINKIQFQLSKTYDLLEQEIYSKELFIERSTMLKNQIQNIKNNLLDLEEEKEKILKSKNNKELLIPKIENVISSYYKTDDIEIKNRLLKTILEKVEYLKINPKDKEDFKLILYPKIL